MSSDIITGIWQSYYEYGKGSDGKILSSQHRIQFVREGSTWLGKSLANQEASEVAITFTQNGDEFPGTWHERTSPSGHYQGREFTGVLLFKLKDSTLDGMWLGAGSRSGVVKAGRWKLTKEMKEEK